MEFDIGRLRRSHWLIGGGGVALFIILFFFHWLGASSNSPLGSYSLGLNGWHSFTISRWIWLITIIVAIGAALIAAGALKFQSPVQPSVVVAGLGALSTILILYRIIHHPHGGSSETIASVHISASYGIKIGIWLGLIAAAVITYGGYEAMNEDGTSLSDVREQATRAVGGMGAQSAATSDPTAAGSPDQSAAVAPPIPPAAPAGNPAEPPLPPPSQ